MFIDIIDKHLYKYVYQNLSAIDLKFYYILVYFSIFENAPFLDVFFQKVNFNF